MKIALISDIHANLEALEVVVEDIKKNEKPDKVIFLGDIVGYGANPNECCAILKEIADVCIMGNHDAALVGETDLEWFSENARIAIEIQREMIDEEYVEWIKSFSWIYEEKNFIFSHGSPLGPENFDYVIDPIRASFILSWLDQENKRAAFVGHAHITTVFYSPQEEPSYPERDFPDLVQLGNTHLWVINVGSVGQPRDGDPRAAYSILDTDSDVYRVKRLEYDIESAALKIKEAGLPDFLWQRLYRGI